MRDDDERNEGMSPKTRRILIGGTVVGILGTLWYRASVDKAVKKARREDDRRRNNPGPRRKTDRQK